MLNSAASRVALIKTTPADVVAMIAAVASKSRHEVQDAVVKAVTTNLAHASLYEHMKCLPPYGIIPQTEKDIDSIPLPWRAMWEASAVKEELAQLTTDSFDLIPVDSGDIMEGERRNDSMMV